MQENSAVKIFEKIIELTDIKGRKLLEVGCGDGRITSLLHSETDRITAIDPFEKAVNKAKDKFPAIDFRVGSGEELQFAPETFDTVLFTLSLHHQNSVKALHEAGRVVTSDGEIIVAEPVVGSELADAFRFIHDEDIEKKQALQAVYQSGLQLVCEHVVKAEWLFDDKHDFIDSIFSYYDQKPDFSVTAMIYGKFSDVINDTPIILKDEIRIQILRKSL